MRGLVFGAGSIYSEFYYPIFKQLNIKTDIIDPRLNLNNKYSNLFYDFILISSPPQFHYENFLYVIENNISYSFIIVEKPAITRLNDFFYLKQHFESIGADRVFTVTPRRLSIFGQFWNKFGNSIDSLNLVYGVQSKWVLNSDSHIKFNSCAFDLGPHFFDLINCGNVNLQTYDPILVEKYVSFNDFKINYKLGNLDVNLYLSRKDYLSNIVTCKRKNSEKIIFNLDNNNGFYTNSKEFIFDLNTTDSIKEFKKLFQGNASSLFSDFKEFYSTLTILDKLYD